jgi:hypothetical protein
VPLLEPVARPGTDGGLKPEAGRNPSEVIRADSEPARAVRANGSVIDIPATSPLAKEGLKNDLAAQAGIPRDILGDPSSIWGKPINDIIQSFTMDGAAVSPSTKKEHRAMLRLLK